MGGFKTPRTAKDGNYVDKRCPFTGNVRIRGRILTGVVRKLKMQRTIIVRRDYLYFVKKYGRFEKRHNNMAVHMSPCFMDVEAGDIVTMGECRPLSKTVRFNVIKHTKPHRTEEAVCQVLSNSHSTVCDLTLVKIIKNLSRAEPYSRRLS